MLTDNLIVSFSGPGIMAKYVRISNKGTTFSGAWDIFELQFEGKNLPTKYEKKMFQQDANGVLSDGSCNVLNLFDGLSHTPWFVKYCNY